MPRVCLAQDLSLKYAMKGTSKGEAYLQDFSDIFLTFLKTCLDIIGYGQARRQGDTWPSCCKNLTKESIIDDIDWAITFCDPLYKLSTRKVVSNSMEYNIAVNDLMYWTSSFVCMQYM